MKYPQKLSARAVKDLDALEKTTRRRVIDRIAVLADSPYDPRFSIKLTDQGGLRRSRVGGWRIIFLVDDDAKELIILTIARRGSATSFTSMNFKPWQSPFLTRVRGSESRCKLSLAPAVSTVLAGSPRRALNLTTLLQLTDNPNCGFICARPSCVCPPKH